MQYRIIRNNKCAIAYRYYIQRKWFGLFWLPILDQAYNEYDLDMVEGKLSSIIEKEKEYTKRKLTKNNEVIKYVD